LAVPLHINHLKSTKFLEQKTLRLALCQAGTLRMPRDQCLLQTVGFTVPQPLASRALGAQWIYSTGWRLLVSDDQLQDVLITCFTGSPTISAQTNIALAFTSV